MAAHPGKILRTVADIEPTEAPALGAVESAAFLQPPGASHRRLPSRIDQGDALSHDIRKDIRQQGKMGAAQNEGVDLLLRQRLQIPRGGQPGHRIVPVDPSVLHQGNEQGTGALKHPKSGIVQLQSSPEGVGPDGGRRVPMTPIRPFRVARAAASAADSTTPMAGKGSSAKTWGAVELTVPQGGDDHFYIHSHEKAGSPAGRIWR